MTDENQNEQNEQKDELRDLDVREEQAEAVKGGIVVYDYEGTAVIAKPKPISR